MCALICCCFICWFVTCCHLTVYHYTALFLRRFFFRDRVCDACTVLLGGAVVVIHCDSPMGQTHPGQALDRCGLIAPPGGPAGIHTLTHRKQTETFPTGCCSEGVPGGARGAEAWRVGRNGLLGGPTEANGVTNGSRTLTVGSLSAPQHAFPSLALSPLCPGVLVGAGTGRWWGRQGLHRPAERSHGSPLVAAAES